MQKFLVSRDDAVYLAFPDVALSATGRLVAVFLECTHHGQRDYTRVMVCDSTDRGRTWSPKRPLTEALRGDPASHPWWNCPRITALPDGRLVVVVDRVRGKGRQDRTEQSQHLYFSADDGVSWSAPQAIPCTGIVPDRLLVGPGPNGGERWWCGCHHSPIINGQEQWAVRYWWSDDRGATWQGPSTVYQGTELQLCEPSLVCLPEGGLMVLLRENSFRGLDLFKSLSHDGGLTWSAPTALPIPAAHRPVAGWLRDGRLLITHRFMQGGQGWVGWWTQNTFATLTDLASCLAPSRAQAHTRILPLDFDRSSHSDTGYTGWVQFPDGEIYVVNYIVDDAPKGQIRGYALHPSDFMLS